MIEYICDGCGLRVKTAVSSKPASWFQRTETDENGYRKEYHACSRKCIDKLAKEQGMTGVVLPW